MNGYIFFIFLSFVFSLLYFLVEQKNSSYKETHILLTALLALALFIEVIGELTARKSYNNSLVYNVLFVYGETCMFLYFYYLISDSQKIKKRIKVFAGLFLLFGIVCSVFFQPIHLEFHNYSFALGSMTLIVLAINFYFDVFNFNQYEEKNLLSVPYFWIVTVILFFYSATFFYFTPVRLLYDMEKALIAPLAIIIRFLAGLMYIVIGLAFYAPLLFREKY